MRIRPVSTAASAAPSVPRRFAHSSADPSRRPAAISISSRPFRAAVAPRPHRQLLRWLRAVEGADQKVDSEPPEEQQDEPEEEEEEEGSSDEILGGELASLSIYEIEAPDSMSRVLGSSRKGARDRLEDRRERLQRELEAVEDAITGLSSEVSVSESMPSADYSYLAKSAGRYTDDLPTGPPANALVLGMANFRRELRELIAAVTGRAGDQAATGYQGVDSSFSYKDAVAALAEEAAEGRLSQEPGAAAAREIENTRLKLKLLTISNQAVWDREHAREEAGGAIRSPYVLKGPYLFLCVMIDVLFDGKPIERFWFLENVARMPYLSYVSMLHLYESLGWWRRGARVKQIHFAEEWNEFHHLLIMESLGGDQAWSTRFFAQHASIAYYFALCALWLLSPTLAYNFSELIEAHAVDSYDQFLVENEAVLKRLPPPPIAIDYYMGEDMYKYDEFQSEREPGSRRQRIETLYDVIESISGDEAEHVKTMAACQRRDLLEKYTDVERTVLLTGGAAVLLDVLLRRVAASEIELPEALSGIADFAQAYADSGFVEALLDVFVALFPFLG